MKTVSPALQFNGLSKRYGKTPAVSSLSLEVDAGTTFGLIGANGAGKTTLIKCLLDFCGFQAGSINIFGIPSHRTEARSRLAFLPERFIPPYYLSGKDFLQFMSQMYGRRGELEDNIATLSALDLSPDILARPVRLLSKGMTQKLGLAGCLLSARELLVMDEPASGLDPKARALFKAALKAVQAAGRTVFLTSHSLVDVDEMCDQIGVMHQGALRYCGSPAQLKQHYEATTLEQAFLRSIGEN
ncbi:MAG: ATP-binding cassette domain-containing protein [Burkholderiales bacterium]|nr:ATP-binding cassette domain-containing protein [Burkholderiales bacterium]